MPGLRMILVHSSFIDAQFLTYENDGTSPSLSKIVATRVLDYAYLHNMGESDNVLNETEEGACNEINILY